MSSMAQAARYYLYQLPDGSRLMSDRPRYEQAYRLIRKSTQVKGMGQLVAGAYQSRVRTGLAQIKRFEPLIIALSKQHQVDLALVKAVIRTESDFNPNATSRRGASGLMQLMPQTAAHYGVSDLYSPQQNLDAGIRYLRDLLKRYDNRLYLVLAAYNAGESAVAKYKGVPPYRETQRYVKKVMQYKTYYSRH
ncbi:Membrane-bound lytic murein transglycosylase D precursor [hydrothermal vent metagenome]|uniref:Membrane-bound lytic murein transglycosylase D n=1 Tax=hydrothermal vent metagenome TaxID=652676 RepID=A0A3B1BMB7_9ZZZZ